jgi:hypothetical protein
MTGGTQDGPFDPIKNETRDPVRQNAVNPWFYGAERPREQSRLLPKHFEGGSAHENRASKWSGLWFGACGDRCDEGRTAAQMLGEIIEDRPLRSRRVELSTELIMRESTGLVPGTAR